MCMKSLLTLLSILYPKYDGDVTVTDNKEAK